MHRRASVGMGSAAKTGALVVLCVSVAGLIWAVASDGASAVRVKNYRVRVVARYPHDPEAFTQGLVYYDGVLFESTGQYGASTLRRVRLETGEVEQQHRLPRDVFAEGLALIGDRLVQLTWREGKAFVWERDTFALRASFRYPGEGWGLCDDGQQLVMSSGTDRLVFRDRHTFRKIGEVRVTQGGEPVRQLNELECVGNKVYANVWTEDALVEIDPATGQVTARIDASGLLPEEDRTGNEDVLNGVAYLPRSGHFLLTGKNWPYLYEVVLEETR